MRACERACMPCTSARGAPARRAPPHARACACVLEFVRVRACVRARTRARHWPGAAKRSPRTKSEQTKVQDQRRPAPGPAALGGRGAGWAAGAAARRVRGHGGLRVFNNIQRLFMGLFFGPSRFTILSRPWSFVRPERETESEQTKSARRMRVTDKDTTDELPKGRNGCPVFIS